MEPIWGCRRLALVDSRLVRSLGHGDGRAPTPRVARSANCRCASPPTSDTCCPAKCTWAQLEAATPAYPGMAWGTLWMAAAGKLRVRAGQLLSSGIKGRWITTSGASGGSPINPVRILTFVSMDR